MKALKGLEFFERDTRQLLEGLAGLLVLLLPFERQANPLERTALGLELNRCLGVAQSRFVSFARFAVLLRVVERSCASQFASQLKFRILGMRELVPGSQGCLFALCIRRELRARVHHPRVGGGQGLRARDSTELIGQDGGHQCALLLALNTLAVLVDQKAQSTGDSGDDDPLQPREIGAQELRRRVGAPCESIIDDLGGAQSFGCRLIALGFASFAAARRSLCPQSLDRKSACRDTEYGSMVCECIKYDNIYRYEKAESII